jgi:hypothetical protein
MLKFIKDKIAAIWQDRFYRGVGGNLGGGGITVYDQGIVISLQGPMVVSVGSGHWPWFLFELAGAVGLVPSWHVGVLGFTVGMVMQHNIDEKGEVAGPDFQRFYWFFKGLNHQGKELEEII